MINLRVRFKNPVFIAQLLLSIIVPILGYFGLTAQDVTSWKKLFDLLLSAASNPYVVSMIIISVWNTMNDPTTKGIVSDSTRAMNYKKPQ